MRFSTFKPKTPRRERKDRSDEFANFAPKSREFQRISAEATACIEEVLGPGFIVPLGCAPKTPDRKRQDIRDAARDEPCLIRIVGCCNHRTDTTVAAHWPGIAGGRGMGMKSIDLAVAFACSACHDAVDARAPLPPGATRESVLLDWCEGHLRTLERVAQKGLL